MAVVNINQFEKNRWKHQQRLKKCIVFSNSVISRYERDEMLPSIEVAKKLATLLGTTVGYLLGETEDADLFKDPEMLKRFRDISHIGFQEREHILFALDSMIQKVKLKNL